MFFYAIQLAYVILRNFHCEAVIPAVELFGCFALEPMINSKCKPGESQLAVLKLESCCDVIKRLFSTATAGQDNVSAERALLEAWTEFGYKKWGDKFCVTGYIVHALDRSMSLEYYWYYRTPTLIM